MPLFTAKLHWLGTNVFSFCSRSIAASSSKTWLFVLKSFLSFKFLSHEFSLDEFLLTERRSSPSQPITQKLSNSSTLFLLLLSGLRTLSTVLGTTLCAVGNTGCIERAAHDVITNTREVLHTTATHQHDGVLLQVVSLSGNVTVDFLLVSQTNTGYLTHSRIRLLRGAEDSCPAQVTSTCRRLPFCLCEPIEKL